MQYFRATKQRRNINYSSCNEEDIVEVENFFWFILFIFYFLYSFFVRLNLSLWNIVYSHLIRWKYREDFYRMYIRVYHVAITSLEYIVLNLYFLAFSSRKIYIDIIYIKGKTIVSKGKQKFVDFIIMKNSKCIFKQIIIPRSGLVPKFPSERSTRIEDTTSSTVGLQSGQSDDIRTTIGFVQERRSRRVGAQRRCKVRIFVPCWTEER